MDDQTLIAELKQRVEILQDIIKRALPCAYHSKECDYTLDQQKQCTCWVIDAYANIPSKKEKEEKPRQEVNPLTLCMYCKHPFNYHTCRMDGHFGCSKISCACEDFKY